MLYSVKLEIAGMVSEITSDDSRYVSWLKHKCSLFLSCRQPSLRIEIVKQTRNHGKGVSAGYQSRWLGQRLFVLTKPFEISYDFGLNKVKVYVKNGAGIVDIVRFVYFIALLPKHGLLMHACGVEHKGLSYVFFGPSESGKTTIARLSLDNLVLSDETIAIRAKKKGFFAYSTPFVGEYGRVEKNAGALIKAVFFINKADHFKHIRIPPLQALHELLGNNLISIFNKVLAEHLLNALIPLVTVVPCYRLYFKKDTNIWRYIDEHVR